jgi:hypothetical protein
MEGGGDGLPVAARSPSVSRPVAASPLTSLTPLRDETARGAAAARERRVAEESGVAPVESGSTGGR